VKRSRKIASLKTLIGRHYTKTTIPFLAKKVSSSVTGVPDAESKGKARERDNEKSDKWPPMEIGGGGQS